MATPLLTTRRKPPNPGIRLNKTLIRPDFQWLWSRQDRSIFYPLRENGGIPENLGGGGASRADVVLGGPTWLTYGGDFGPALRCLYFNDGDSDYFQIATAGAYAAMGSGDFTLFVTISVPSGAPLGVCQLIGDWTGAGGELGFNVGLTGNDFDPRFNDNDSLLEVEGQDIAADGWLNCIVTYDDTTYTIEGFIEGVSEGDASGIASMNSDVGQRLTLGRAGGFSGQYAEFYVAQVGMVPFKWNAQQIKQWTREPFGWLELAEEPPVIVSAATIHSGVCSMTGSGVVTVAETMIKPGVVAMTGAGTLTSAAGMIKPGVVSMVGTGLLTSVAAIYMSGVCSMTGTGVLTSAALVYMSGVVSMTGSGTLTVASSAIRPGVCTMTATGVLTADGTIVGTALEGVCAMTGAGTLTVASSAIRPGASSMTGSGSVTAVASMIKPGVVAMTGTGVLTVSGVIPSTATYAILVDFSISTATLSGVSVSMAQLANVSVDYAELTGVSVEI